MSVENKNKLSCLRCDKPLTENERGLCADCMHWWETPSEARDEFSQRLNEIYEMGRQAYNSRRRPAPGASVTASMRQTMANRRPIKRPVAAAKPTIADMNLLKQMGILWGKD